MSVCRSGDSGTKWRRAAPCCQHVWESWFGVFGLEDLGCDFFRRGRRLPVEE